MPRQYLTEKRFNKIPALLKLLKNVKNAKKMHEKYIRVNFLF